MEGNKGEDHDDRADQPQGEQRADHGEPRRWWAKYVRLANLAANDVGELWNRVIDERIEVKFRPDLLRGFIRQTGLPGVSLAE